MILTAGDCRQTAAHFYWSAMPTIHEKITKAFINGLKKKPPCPPGEELFVFDTELDCFGLRVQASGKGSYFILHGPKRGRKFSFGKLGLIAPDEARKEATDLLAQTAKGFDPAAKRQADRETLTVAQLCEKYLEAARGGFVLTRFGKAKRASTVAIDDGRVARHIVPLIGSTKVDKLNKAAIQRMADDISNEKTAGVFKTKARGKAVVTGGAGTAARVVELLGGIWSWAELRGFVAGTNPAHGVQKMKGDAKDRTLSADELAKLGQVMRDNQTRHPAAVSALRLIALTGLRREESCGLRWSEIDRASSCLRLEATKTGRSMRPIGNAVFDVLASVPKSESAWLFPNRSGKASADLKKAIAAIFDAADLKDARAHDLRRTFGSTAANEGYGDATIAELLGHARRGVTERHYIRRADAALIAAADKVSTRIAAAMEGRAGDVLKFPRAGAGDE
jgi:integrase